MALKGSNLGQIIILHKIHTISISLSGLNVNLSFILINKTNGPRPRHNFLEFLICWTLSKFTQSIYTLVQVGFNASTIRECRFLKRKERNSKTKKNPKEISFKQPTSCQIFPEKPTPWKQLQTGQLAFNHFMSFRGLRKIRPLKDHRKDEKTALLNQILDSRNLQ